MEVIMINVNNPKVKEVLAEIHKGIERKTQKDGIKKEEIIIESRIFSVICNDCGIGPTNCALAMNERFGYDLTGDEVIQVFRKRRMANPVERKELFQWAEDMADYFAQAIQGNESSFQKFEKFRREPALKNGKKHDSQERLIAIMLFEKYPELDIYEDREKLHLLGNTLAKYCFYEMVDGVSNTYNFAQLKDDKKKQQKNTPEKKLSLEEAMKKINQLETTLERTNTMLSDLQDEFEEQLEESKVKELTDFFARLNSEKYGCILDELLVIRKGIDQLRKNNYELPIEINGLLIMVKKLIQFVRDSHIEPIMKVNSTHQVTASDVEFCNYEGTPFTSAEEVKTVTVVSPGWIYKDKEIQISRPKVKD